MRSNGTLLEARRLAAFYGDFQALFDIDFRIERNETVAIIGSNGAGKSTLLKSIIGLVRAKAEAIYFDGKAIGGNPAYRIVAQGISMVPEGRRLFPSLSVEEIFPLARTANARDRGILKPSTRFFPCSRKSATLRQRRSPEGNSRWWLSGGP